MLHRCQCARFAGATPLWHVRYLHECFSRLRFELPATVLSFLQMLFLFRFCCLLPLLLQPLRSGWMPLCARAMASEVRLTALYRQRSGAPCFPKAFAQPLCASLLASVFCWFPSASAFRWAVSGCAHARHLRCRQHFSVLFPTGFSQRQGRQTASVRW